MPLRWPKPRQGHTGQKPVSTGRYDEPFYQTPEWRAARAAHLRVHPCCQVCWTLGYRTIGRQVDHIVSRRVAPARSLDPTNLQTLCDKHHGSKTMCLDVRRRGEASPRRREATGPDGYPVNSEWSAK
jgi:5-methylcytosine-specific restriction protein A